MPMLFYESRLELARLLLADFDTAVMHIVAQPLLLVASVEGKQRKHIPDYLLLTNDGPVVVDVKPRQHLTKPVVVRTFTWTRKAVESRGWRYEVWSEAPTVLLENVRFLAGYRRARLFESALIDRASASSGQLPRRDPAPRCDRATRTECERGHSIARCSAPSGSRRAADCRRN